jgi:gliding motility-associated-like protein
MTKKKETTNGFEKTIKSKVDGFEFPYEPADWAVMESMLDALPKGLPGNPGFKIGAIAIVAATITASIIYFTNIKEVDSTIITEPESMAIVDEPAVPASTPALEIEVEYNEPVETQTNLNIRKISESKAKASKQATSQTIKAHQKSVIVNNDEPFRKHELSAELETDLTLAAVVTPDASFTIDKINGCSPMTVQFTPNEFSDTIFYLWNFGNGLVSTLPDPLIIFNQPGDHNVTLTATYFKSNAEATFTYPQAINVLESPDAGFTYYIEDDAYIFTPTIISYPTYHWILADLSFENQHTLSYNFTRNGVYSISCIAQSENGCLDTTKQMLEIIIEHPLHIANAFTPDGDSENDYFGPKCDMSDIMKMNFQIYSRDGFLVFESNEINGRWDGNLLNGQKAKEAVYMWKIITTDKDNHSCKKTGSVTLLRIH